MKVLLPGSGKRVNNLWLKIHISLIIQVLLHPVKLLFKDIFGALDYGSHWAFFHTLLELAVIYHWLIGM